MMPLPPKNPSLLACIRSVLFLLLAFISSAHALSSSLQLFPYQAKGVEQLVADKRLLLADEMGLGKTCQAISALNRLGETGQLKGGQGRVLIISPKSVLNVWVDELEKWLDSKLDLDVSVCTAGGAPTDPSTNEGYIQLINYDICDKHKDILRAAPYDVLICDEAHYLKSHDAKRTLAILGNSVGRRENKKGIQSKYLWLLTGTPIMNRPIELYPLLRALDADGSSWEAMKDFIDRYCEPKEIYRGNRRGWGRSANGASNLQELKRRLKPFMLRRYKADVLPDLPPKLRSCITLDGGAEAAVQERRLVAEMMGLNIDDRYQGSEYDYEGHFADNSLVSFGAEASTLTAYGIKPSDFEDEKFLGALATIRKETAMRKIKPAFQLLKDVISCEKVVVFAHHRQLIIDLAEEFGNKAVHIIGGMDTETRAEAVRRFQNDDRCRIFIGSIRAAGVGVTLTAASHVVFLEMDWSPAIMAQAEDRCHRVGQQDSVLCQYYVFRDTIDEWIARQLIAKEVVTTMALPMDTDVGSSHGDVEANARMTRRGYEFDFGKHKGLRMEDVPESYLQFIVGNEAIWKKRPALWDALFRRGLVRNSSSPAGGEKSRFTTSRATAQDKKKEGQNKPARDDRDVEVEYVFDFGKHRGEKWNSVPRSYRGWIVKNDVWKNRSNLKQALLSAGVIDVD